MARRRSRFRRVLRVTLWTLGVLLLLLILAWLLRGPLFSGPLARLVASELSDALGGRFTLESVEGTFYDDVVLIGLRTVEAPAEGTVRSASFERVRVAYGLLDLLGDKSPLDALREVEVAGLELVLDLRGPAGPPSDQPASLQDVVDLLPRKLPRMDIAARLELLTDDGPLVAQRVRIDGTPERLDLGLEGVQVPPVVPAPLPSRVRLVVERRAAGAFRVSSPDDLSGVALRALDVAHEGGDAWSAGLRAGVAGAAVTASAGPEAAEARVAHLDCAKLPAWLPELIGEEDVLPTSGLLSVEAAVTYPPEGEVEGRFTVDGSDVTWRGLADVRLDGAGALVAGAVLRVDRLDVRAEGAHVTVEGADIDPEHPFVVRRLAALGADVPDARDVLRRAGVELPDVTWPEAAVALTADVGASTPGSVAVRRIRVQAGEDAVTLSGSVAPAADPDAWRASRLDLGVEVRLPDLARLGVHDEALRGLAGELRADARVSRTLGDPEAALDVEVRGLVVRGQAVGDVTVSGTLDWPRATVRELRAQGGVGRLSATGTVDLEAAGVADGTLDLELPEVGRVARVLGLGPEAGGSLRASGRVAKDTGAWETGWRGALDVTGEALAWDGRELGALVLAAEVSWPRCEVGSFRLDGPVARVSGAGFVELDAARPAAALRGLSVEVPSLSALAPFAPGLADVAGSVTVKADATRERGRPWTAFQGSATVAARDVALSGTAAGSLSLELTNDGADVRLRELEAEGPWGRVRAAGGATVGGEGGGSASLASLEGRYEGQDVALLDPLRAEWTPDGTLDVPAFALRVLSGEVRGSLRLGTDVALEARADGVDLGRLPGDLGLSGLAGLHLLAGGSLERPRVTVKVEAPKVGWRGEAAAVRLEARQDDQGVVVDALQIDLVGGASLSGSGRLPLVAGTGGVSIPEEARAAFRLEAGVRDVALLRRLGLPDRLSFEKALVELRLEEDALSVSGRVAAPEVALGEGAPPVVQELRFSGRATAAQSSVRVEGSGGKGLVVDGTARLAAGFDPGRPGESVAAWPDAPLEADVRLRLPDLGHVGDLVPGLLRLRGAADVTLEARGTPSAPEPSGRARIEDLALRAKGDLPGLDEGEVEVRLEGRTLHLEKVQGLLGFAPLRAGGTIELPEGGAAPVFDVTVQGENVLLARTQHLRLRSDLDLSLRGPLRELVLGGTVRVTDAVYSEPMSLTASSAPTAPSRGYALFSLRREPLSTMQFDLQVLADRSIHVSNNMLRGDVSINLDVRGTGAVPRPSGRISFAGLRVALPFSRLKVDRGDLVFEEDFPFAPRLAVAATTRMRGYDLEVIVQGRLPDPPVVVESEPYLPQQDALALLTLGATPAGLKREGLSNAALSRVGSLVGESVLAEITGPSDPDEESIGDRISLEVGRDVSVTGASTIEFEYRLLEKLYLRAERDRYDDYNLGVVWRLRFK